MMHSIAVLAPSPAATKPSSATVTTGSARQTTDPDAFGNAMRRHGTDTSAGAATSGDESPSTVADAVDDGGRGKPVHQEDDRPANQKAHDGDAAEPPVVAEARPHPNPARPYDIEGTAPAVAAATLAPPEAQKAAARSVPDVAAKLPPPRGEAERATPAATSGTGTTPARSAGAGSTLPAVTQAEAVRLPPALARAVAAAAAAEGKVETDSRLQTALRALLRSGSTDAVVQQPQRAEAALAAVALPQAIAQSFGGNLAAEPPPLPARSPEMLAQAATRALVEAAADGNWRVSLRLDPPELGRLEVQLAREQGALTASFVAASPAARGLLEQAMPMLQTQLSAAGMSLADASVSQQGAGRHAPGGTDSGNVDGGDGRSPGEGVPLDPVTAAVRRQEGLFEGWA